MSDIARYYDRDANPDGRVFHGVPLADLTQPTWDSLPKWLQESVDASGMYRKSKPPGKAESKATPAAASKKKKPAARKPAPVAPAVGEPAPVVQAATPVESEG
jgi:hypothetical protein